MTKIILFASLLLLFTPKDGISQNLEKVGSEELIALLNDPSDKLHVINFWATWCSPCVTELPYFEEAATKFKNDNAEFTLVSLDFPSQAESRLIPFLKEKNISLKVLLMEDLDYDKWLSKVDGSWKGNLPATLIINNAEGKREFVAGALEKEELYQLIENNIN